MDGRDDADEMLMLVLSLLLLNSLVPSLLLRAWPAIELGRGLSNRYIFPVTVAGILENADKDSRAPSASSSTAAATTNTSTPATVAITSNACSPLPGLDNVGIIIAGSLYFAHWIHIIHRKVPHLYLSLCQYVIAAGDRRSKVVQ